MHILLIHQYYLEKNDGGGSRWNEMTLEWTRQGHQVTVLSGMAHYTTGLKHEKYKGKYFFDDANFENNIRVIRSHVSEAYNVNFIGRLWGYFSFVFSSIWAGLFYAKEKYDVIVVTSPPLFVGITAYILSKFKRIPFIFEIRDLWPESAIDTGVVTNPLIIRVAYAFENFIYKKAKLINVLTPAFRKVLIEKKNVDPKKIIYIPNAADFSIVDSIEEGFDPIEFRKEKNLPINDFLILYVGAHGVANHLIQVLDTAEKIKDIPVSFVLIGDGMQKKMLIEEKEKRQLSNVIFLDPVSKKEVFKYIKSCDMGASILKKNDTFKTVYSNKTFDYMSCSKPIFMLIDGVSRELVEEADAGIYSPPEEPEVFEKHIREYLNDPQKVIQQGQNGYAFVRKNFDRSTFAKQYVQFIESLKK